ncbi:hypothetical protein H4F99_12705 [Lysobacter sp. SG-8]|uniref:Secreted protein n=1 Tax=Marilutibacter penaei TaxID=2759900 RepID=A0A7W3U5N4_9GAMM|nr:hypothetical protein [Lysobacter penaei]MBB1089338.1 hypothetical protein [Lysobacter penaei]
MTSRNNCKTLLMTFGAVLALSACGGGADRVASPGEGSFPPAPPPVTPPPVTPPPVTPPPTGASCPSGTTDVGEVAGLKNCELPARIIGDFTLENLEGVVYSLNGRTDVGEDMGGDVANPYPQARQGILRIEPGVTLFGSAGADFLMVNRGSQIFAEGTAAEPIVMTSRESVEGTTDVNSIGQWGGLVLLGRAAISTCPGTAQPGSATCEAQVEGANGFFGGNDDADNTGVLRYVRVMHSGFEVLPDVELNGITMAGLGSGTTVEYVQVHNSSDDGIEWFGGKVNSKYLVMTGIDDDSFDTDSGFRGAIQFGLIVQRDGGGDRVNEMSSQDLPYRSNPVIANVTFVSKGHDNVVVLNQGTLVNYYNAVFTGGNPACIEFQSATTEGTFDSTYASCDTPFAGGAGGAEEAAFNAGTNNSTGASSLTDGFVNGANESAVPAFTGLSSVNAFFEDVDYIGAVKDAGDTWWEGWTCGLTAADPC